MESILILGASILLQLAAAFLALSMTRTTGRQYAWIILGVAILLMAVRRSITFVHLLSSNLAHTPDLTAELVALTISVLMVIGLAGIGPFFQAVRHSEQALRASEDRYRDLFENAHDLIQCVGVDGRFVYVNPAWRKTLGYTEEEVRVLSMFDVIHPENWAHCTEVFERMMAGEEIAHLETTLVRKDGSTIIVEGSNSCQFRDGEMVATRGIFHDITAYKRAEEREASLGRILDESLNEIYIFDCNTLRFIQVNRGARENLGYSMDEFRAMTPLDLKPEFTPTSFSAHIQPLSSRAREKVEFTTLHRRKDGTLYPVEVHLQRSHLEASPVFVAIILDITERKEAEETLRRNEVYFRSLIENALDVITVIDAQATILYESPSIERTLGYTPEELVGQSVFDFVHPDDLLQTLEVFRKSLMVPQVSEPLAFRYRHKDGSWRVIEAIGKNIDDETNGLVVVINSRDITERKQFETELIEAKEKAEEVSRLKSALLNNLSHEIRTPLTGIISAADVLCEDLEDEEHEMAVLISQSGERLLETLNAVLDLARLEATTIKLAPEPVELGSELEALDRLFRPVAREKGLALQVKTPSDAVPIHLDHACLHRILVNLVSNAIKFTEQGTVTLETRTEADHVLITVSDTGIGIDEAFLPHLFEEFIQESTGLTRSHEGTGLGLAITRRLVDLMGGTITVESTKGEGSTFTVSFPNQAVEQEPSSTEETTDVPTLETERLCRPLWARRSWPSKQRRTGP